MRVSTKVIPPPPVHSEIELTMRLTVQEAAVLYALTGVIGGDPNSPGRKLTQEIREALAEFSRQHRRDFGHSPGITPAYFADFFEVRVGDKAYATGHIHSKDVPHE